MPSRRPPCSKGPKASQPGDLAPQIVRIEVRAKPRARSSRVVRAAGLSVDVAVAAPPVDGAANEELLVFLARVLEVPRRALDLVGGKSSKYKVVEVTGLAPEAVIERMAAAMA
jgi:uncharacterized protein YggU (UPF0235/DUF167 family)